MTYKIHLLLLALAVNITLSFAEDIDYCNKNLCKRKGQHIACGNDGQINAICAAFSEIIPLTPEMKANIVKKHNEYRNKLALGQVSRYPPALRMATIQWDDVLAHMADLNLRTCSTTHDQCRNTFRFRHSGQNIARRTINKNTITMNQLEYNIYHGIDRWFREHLLCPTNGTTTYTNDKKKCGHFTVMVVERNTHVGCAAMLMKRQRTVFTCNYAHTNIRRARIYRPGKSASECKTGSNAQYPGLCSTNERYE